MNPQLRTLVMGYGSASLLQGLVGVMAVPLLILTLGQQGFAYWAMLEPLVAALAGLALLGAHYGHLYGITSNTLAPGAALGQMLRFAWAPAVPVVLLGTWAMCQFMGLGGQVATVVLCALYVAAETCILVFQFHSRALSDAATYATVVWMRSLCVLAGLLIFRVLQLHIELTHYLAFMVMVDSITLLFVVARYRRNLSRALATPADAPSAYWDAVRYGLPITLAAVLAMLAGNVDRYVVHSFMVTTELPAYIVMVKLAGALSFAMAPINLWWPVARNRHTQSPDGGQAFFSSAVQVLLAYYLVAAACLWVAAEHILKWYAQGITGFDPTTFLLLLMGGVALSMSTPINIGMLTPGKTRWLIVTVGVGACTALGLAIYLVPRLGYVGAGWATLGAQLLNLLFTHWASQRIYRVNFKLSRMLVLCVVAAAMFGLLYWQRGSVVIQLAVLAITVTLYAYFLRREVRELSKNTHHGFAK